MECPYNLSKLAVVDRRFRAVFHTEFRRFFNHDSRFLSLVYGKIIMDIYAFDDFLHAFYGEYEEQGKNMLEVIAENYGQKGVDLIIDLMPEAEK